MVTTLVIGGTRSGKSRHAEALVASASEVTYVATGRPDDGTDPEWAVRLAAHRERRSRSWHVVETLDLVGVLDAPTGAVVVDCLGTWLAGLVDVAGAWEDLETAAALVRGAGDALSDALRRARVDVVVVTNEVGLAPVPLTASGRFFQDELGRLNAAVAAACDRVHLVVAGRVLDLSDAPVVR